MCRNRQSPPEARRTAGDQSSGLKPRLRCVFTVKDKCDSTRTERVRVYSQDMPDLRELYDGIDEDHSRRAASKLTIPFLLSGIDVMRDPQRVERIMRVMVVNLGFAWALIEVEDNRTGSCSVSTLNDCSVEVARTPNGSSRP